MDYQKLFRSTGKNGFNRDDVIQYMQETEKNTQSAQEELKDQIELLTQSKEELTQEISAFSSHVEELEQQLEEEKEHVRRVSSMRDYLYTELEHKQQELDEEVKARQDDLAACKREIERYLAQKKKMQKQVEELSVKNQKYDELQGNLKRIRMKAEAEAYQMVETAKEQSMDAISVVDDVVEEISLFRSDVGKIREDIHIGTETAEDRLNALYDSLDHYVGKLKGIKERFYEAHHLPLSEESYQYTSIAPGSVQENSECAEAEEELPSGGGRENLLPIPGPVANHMDSHPVICRESIPKDGEDVCQEAAEEP